MFARSSTWSAWDGMLTSGFLSDVRHLKIAPSQVELAKELRRGRRMVGGRGDPLLKAMGIFLQGSTAIGTTVKPIGSNEHDVDLQPTRHISNRVELAAALKKAIGDRLKANGHYKPLLVEMARCWRLVYANEFHMDITPSILKPKLLYGR